DSITDKVLEERRLHSRRHRRVQYALNGDESFFETNRIPHRTPECNALLDSARVHVLRSNLEEPIHGGLRLPGRHAKRIAYARHRSRRNVRARFNEIELPITNNDLVGRKIVPDVRQMNVEDLVPEK